MPKLDGLKEEIGIIKFWLGIAVAVFIAIGGWLINNYKIANNWILFASIIALLFLIFAIFLLNKAMIKKAQEIKNSKK